MVQLRQRSILVLLNFLYWGRIYISFQEMATERGWQLVVKKGEKAIKSVTFIKDEETGDTYPRPVFLFAQPQVSKIN